MVLIRLLHIVISFWFFSGLIGRWLAYTYARRAADIQTAGTLLQLSDRFERIMVIPGSQVLLVSGLLTAWLSGRSLLGGAHANWLLVSLLLYVALIPVVVFLLVPRRRHRLGAIDRALEQGMLTSELVAALKDPVVIWARGAELLVSVVILILMILKPF